jgi:hypothetical protein
MADRIREWFHDHADGEFALPTRDHPYSVVPPSSTLDPVLFTTKPSTVLGALSRGRRQLPCGVIGRYGLPTESDLAWLRSLTAQRALRFLGDADPCDLLVFAWLRSQLDISLRGINDGLLDACGVTPDDRIVIAQANSESDAMRLVCKLIPDLETLVGSTCCKILNTGGKVELESLISFSTVEPKALADAFVASGVP